MAAAASGSAGVCQRRRSPPPQERARRGACERPLSWRSLDWPCLQHGNVTCVAPRRRLSSDALHLGCFSSKKPVIERTLATVETPSWLNTVKTKVRIPTMNDSAYATEFSLRPVERVNPRKVSVNNASCVRCTYLFLRKCRAPFRAQSKLHCVAGGIVQPRNLRSLRVLRNLWSEGLA